MTRTPRDLTHEAGQIVAGARKLRTELLEPVERRFDLQDHPELEDSLAAEVAAGVGRAVEMGLHRVRTPEHHGGLGASPVLALTVTEELAAGAPGYAEILAGDDTVRTVLAEFADAYPGVARILGTADDDPGAIGVAFVQPLGGLEGAVTLPDSGLGVRSRSHRNPGAGTITEVDGVLRLTDVRLPLVPGAECIRQLLLLVGTPPGRSDGVAAFLLPAAAERGMSLGDRPSVLGLRVHSRIDLALDEVMLTAEDEVLGGKDAAALLEQLIGAWSLQTASMAVGIARRAYEHSLEYSRTRVQGGKPIIDHQSVARVLWNASRGVEAARATLHVAAERPTSDLELAVGAATTATEMAGRVSTEMLELLGGYGVTTEYPLEKLFRDAKVLQTATGSIEGKGIFGPVWLP